MAAAPVPVAGLWLHEGGGFVPLLIAVSQAPGIHWAAGAPSVFAEGVVWARDQQGSSVSAGLDGPLSSSFFCLHHNAFGLRSWKVPTESLTQDICQLTE